jgi:hypothetical protein
MALHCTGSYKSYDEAYNAAVESWKWKGKRSVKIDRSSMICLVFEPGTKREKWL